MGALSRTAGLSRLDVAMSPGGHKTGDGYVSHQIGMNIKDQVEASAKRLIQTWTGLRTGPFVLWRVLASALLNLMSLTRNIAQNIELRSNLHPGECNRTRAAHTWYEDR